MRTDPWNALRWAQRSDNGLNPRLVRIRNSKSASQPERCPWTNCLEFQRFVRSHGKEWLLGSCPDGALTVRNLANGSKIAPVITLSISRGPHGFERTVTFAINAPGRGPEQLPAAVQETTVFKLIAKHSGLEGGQVIRTVFGCRFHFRDIEECPYRYISAYERCQIHDVLFAQ